MTNEAVERIKRMVTPEVTILSCQDTPDGIKADVKYSYSLCSKEGVQPTNFIKVFTVLADKSGYVYRYPGLFD